MQALKRLCLRQPSFYDEISALSIPLLRHFTIFNQENAQNMRRYYTVVSRFDRFRTEQIRTERQFFNQKNCFQRDAKPENLACHRLSLDISFVQSNKEHLAGFLSCIHRSQGP